MSSIIGPIILGIFIVFLGYSNTKGNISSIHWYHRARVTEENRLPFGRMVGAGTMIIGIVLILMGCLTFAAEKTQLQLFTVIGSVILIIGIIIGLGLSFYAMIRYNKGIF